MKTRILEFLTLFALILLLCGLQSSFYLLPIPAPALWFVIFCYYSYNKPILTAVILNILLTVILLNFSVGDGGVILGSLNLTTFIFRILKHRFHVGKMQVVISSGVGCFFFFLLLWFANRSLHGIYYPNILSWLSTSFVTLLSAPFVIFPLSKIEKMFLTENMGSLEDLRI